MSRHKFLTHSWKLTPQFLAAVTQTDSQICSSCVHSQTHALKYWNTHRSAYTTHLAGVFFLTSTRSGSAVSNMVRSVKKVPKYGIVPCIAPCGEEKLLDYFNNLSKCYWLKPDIYLQCISHKWQQRLNASTSHVFPKMIKLYSSSFIWHLLPNFLVNVSPFPSVAVVSCGCVSGAPWHSSPDWQILKCLPIRTIK